MGLAAFRRDLGDQLAQRLLAPGGDHDDRSHLGKREREMPPEPRARRAGDEDGFAGYIEDIVHGFPLNHYAIRAALPFRLPIRLAGRDRRPKG